MSFLWILALRSSGSARWLKPVVFNLCSTQPRGLFGDLTRFPQTFLLHFEIGGYHFDNF